MITFISAAAASLAMLAAAPAISTQPISGGPLIAGVCVVSPEALLTSSKVGGAANARLQQLNAEAQRPLQAEQTALNTEARALQAQGAAAPLDPRRQAFSQRLQTFQAQAAQRGRELEATRVQVIQRISQQAQPLIASAYAAHGCGLLLRRSDLLGGNLSNDLTPEVVRAMDAKLTPVSFDRETLPPPAPGQTGS